MSEVTLVNWSIRQDVENIPYLVAQTVLNHPINGSGRYGHSTALVWLDLDRGLAQTLNTLYHLQYPRDELQEPNKQALIKALHPENVPSEVRRAHAERLPWPNCPAIDQDVVAQWIIQRWAKGK